MSVSTTLSAFSALLQNLINVAIVAAICAAGWVGYEHLHRAERLGEFREKLQQAETNLQAERQRNLQLNDRIEKLNTALHLVKVDHRLAEIRVLRQTPHVETGRLRSEIEFVEIAENGHPIGDPKLFTLEGDKVYVDYWVVKFADHYVEQAELNRGTSICLFRGIHGEYQSPAEAYRLDTVGARPAAYARGTSMSEFERQIWDDFWEFANNPELAREKGIRAAHGEEPYMAVREGMTYRLDLRASAGLAITPVSTSSRRAADEPLIAGEVTTSQATHPSGLRSRQLAAPRPFAPRR